MHKSVDVHRFKGRSHIIECICPFVFVFDDEAAIVGEDDFALVFVHVDHFQ